MADCYQQSLEATSDYLDWEYIGSCGNVVWPHEPSPCGNSARVNAS